MRMIIGIISAVWILFAAIMTYGHNYESAMYNVLIAIWVLLFGKWVSDK